MTIRVIAIFASGRLTCIVLLFSFQSFDTRIYNISMVHVQRVHDAAHALRFSVFASYECYMISRRGNNDLHINSLLCVESTVDAVDACFDNNPVLRARKQGERKRVFFSLHNGYVRVRT